MVDKLRLDVPQTDLAEWRQVVAAKANPDGQVDIAMVGKYVQIRDSYMSLNEALMHGGLKTRTRVKIHYIDSTDIEQHGTGMPCRAWTRSWCPAASASAASRARSQAARYAREHGIPYLGICLGMQVAIVEFGRHVLGLTGANSTEFNRATAHPVIALITEWQDETRGCAERATRTRPRAAPCAWAPRRCCWSRHPCARALRQATRSSSATATATSSTTTILDRYRQAGMRFSGFSRDELVEIIEIAGSSLVRRDPVPSRVHLHAARRASAVHRLHPRRARAARLAAAAGGGA